MPRIGSVTRKLDAARARRAVKQLTPRHARGTFRPLRSA